MKLSSYKEFEAKKRAVTIGRIGVIAGAHLLVFGVGYFVTKFGSELEGEQTSVAGANGLVTWSSQSSNAQNPTVDTGTGTVFDSRAASTAGYNAGDTLYAAANGNSGSSSQSASRSGRYAPTRPSENREDSGQQQRQPSQAPVRQNDEVLRPLGGPATQPSGRSADSGAGISETIDYTVQPGDSLWSLSKRFNVSVSDIVAVNRGIKANQIRVGQAIEIPRQSAPASSSAPAASSTRDPQGIESPVAPQGGSIYTVRPGDSLSRIASRQGVTVRELRQANNLSSDMIRVGQELVVPSSTRAQDLVERQHAGPKVVVEPGDTLAEIAAIHDVEVQEIMELNDIDDPRRIRINQVLLIPENGQSTRRQARSPAPVERSTQTTSQAPQQRAQQPQQSQQSQATPAESAPRRTLDELSAEEESRPSLDMLAPDDFQDEEFDDQPLIPIEE